MRPFLYLILFMKCQNLLKKNKR